MMKKMVENRESPDFRSGFIALVGRPSAGKSTLLNSLCGHKVAIVSPKPQTTRNVLRGIVNRHNCQLVFLDTPGFAEVGDHLAKHLREELHSAVRKAEAVLYLVDLSRRPQCRDENAAENFAAGEEHGLLSLLREALNREERPLILAMNKADLLPDPTLYEQRRAAYLALLCQYFPVPCQHFTISAKKQTGLEELLSFLGRQLASGERLYDGDIYTDQEPKFRIQELIREQALSFCGRELPYSLYVEVADLERRDWEGLRSLWVRAFLQLERDSQKGILVGKGGSRIREIRHRSTKALRREFDCPVELNLQVKVDYKWRRKRR